MVVPGTLPRLLCGEESDQTRATGTTIATRTTAATRRRVGQRWRKLARFRASRPRTSFKSTVGTDREASSASCLIKLARESGSIRLPFSVQAICELLGERLASAAQHRANASGGHAQLLSDLLRRETEDVVQDDRSTALGWEAPEGVEDIEVLSTWGLLG
jgi:hypothetical protein